MEKYLDEYLAMAKGWLEDGVAFNGFSYCIAGCRTPLHISHAAIAAARVGICSEITGKGMGQECGNDCPCNLWGPEEARKRLEQWIKEKEGV